MRLLDWYTSCVAAGAVHKAAVAELGLGRPPQIESRKNTEIQVLARENEVFKKPDESSAEGHFREE